MPRSRSRGALIALFAFEQLVNGWRNGFEGPPRTPAASRSAVAMSAATVLFLMTFLFLCFGYMGVPVAFSLIAGVMVGDGLHRRHLRRDRAEDVRRHRFRGAARHSVLPAGRRADELGQRRAAGDRPVARPWSATCKGGLSQVVAVFSMFFSGDVGLDHRRRRRDEPHARRLDATRGLRPALHRRHDRLPPRPWPT